MLNATTTSGLGTRVPHEVGGGSFGHLRRSELAAFRAHSAAQQLRDCQLCAHRCRVNRIAQELGRCHASGEARVFYAHVELGDEPELAPTFAIAFSGCDLRCDFCNTGRDSWAPQAGKLVFDGTSATPALETLAALARKALAEGAQTVMLLGGEPTIHLPAALALAARLPDDATLVWKTNAHGTADARALLDGVFNLWVADYKFGNDACARRLAQVPRYTEVVRENLRWAYDHTHLIIRHLLMPGHLDCCWKPIAEWIAEELPEATVSLRFGFWSGWFSHRHPELRSTTLPPDEAAAVSLARELNLKLTPWNHGR